MVGEDRPAAAPGAEAVLIYTTFPSSAAAETAAEALVNAGLVACANIVPGLVSIFIWEGRLEREQEVAMVMKTRAVLVADVVAETRRLHPYSNPAIVALPIVGGSAQFLDWVCAQTAVPAAAAPRQPTAGAG